MSVKIPLLADMSPTPDMRTVIRNYVNSGGQLGGDAGARLDTPDTPIKCLNPSGWLCDGVICISLQDAVNKSDLSTEFISFIDSVYEEDSINRSPQNVFKSILR